MPPEQSTLEKPTKTKGLEPTGDRTASSNTQLSPATAELKFRPGVSGKFETPPAAASLEQPKPQNQPPTEPTKASVIESKPVIFIPKATKFVPASVRSKLGAAKK